MKTTTPEIIRFTNEDELLKSGVYIKCGEYYIIFYEPLESKKYTLARGRFCETVLKQYAKNYLPTSKEVVEKMKTQSKRVTFETLLEIAEDRATFFIFNSEKLLQTNY